METEAPPTSNAFTTASFFGSSLTDDATPPDPEVDIAEDRSASGPQTSAGGRTPIVPGSTVSRMLEAVNRTQPITEDVSQKTLCLLLLSVLESSAIARGSKGTSQVGSTLHLLQSMTGLFEDVVALWLRSHNKGDTGGDSDLSGSVSDSESRGRSCTPPQVPDCAYKGTVHVARVVLRLCMSLASQILHSSMSVQQLAEMKPLLFAPIVTLSTACENLQRARIFHGNDCLDHEFTFIFLETLFSSLHNINLFAMIPTCSVEDLYHALKGCLTDACNEWFTYLCSKLHGISETGLVPNWRTVMDYCYVLLTHTLRELIIASSHIQSCQKASKSALAGGVSSRPAVYSVEVAMGFDKLTQRLSKLARLLLDVFRTVPMIQFLSLQLLSETTKDTVGIIGSFLVNISDSSVWYNPEVLDHYLDLLESVWFRLSPDYGGSAAWWSKLSNYSSLLCVANQEVVQQVLYHIQCLFSHESTVLKSQLTKHVILPFQTHLLSQVKEKVYESHHQSLESAGTKIHKRVVKLSDSRQALGSDKRTIISLFLKLLSKVAANPPSLGTYLSDTSHLFSLFLLFPLADFRATALGVVEESIMTLKLIIGTELGTSEAALQKNLLQTLLTLAYAAQYVEKIPTLCLSIAEGKMAVSPYGLGEIDQVHQMIQNTFESLPLKQLTGQPFVENLAIVADMWDVLARLAAQDETVFVLLTNNHMWDVIQIFAPSLSGLLSRIQQRLSARDHTPSTMEMARLGEGAHVLREIAVSLLCHLLSLAHYICWQKRDTKV